MRPPAAQMPETPCQGPWRSGAFAGRPALGLPDGLRGPGRSVIDLRASRGDVSRRVADAALADALGCDVLDEVERFCERNVGQGLQRALVEVYAELRGPGRALSALAAAALAATALAAWGEARRREREGRRPLVAPAHRRGVDLRASRGDVARGVPDAALARALRGDVVQKLQRLVQRDPGQGVEGRVVQVDAELGSACGAFPHAAATAASSAVRPFATAFATLG
mmetsp:Transcript_2891/g.7370  ORF Transcript_2891/g.7370 Transcript_2891/m.7370 type:complete len:225 (-) Transcript_2891:255-929(-)